MRKKFFLLVFIIFKFAINADAQLYDAQWAIAGQLSYIDFRNNNVNLTGFGGCPMSMILTAANICDSSGNMLFITNGISIYGNNCNILPNGDSLNPCIYTSNYVNVGLNIWQAALFIPSPENKNNYYLFHFSNDTAGNARPGTLYYSLVNNDSGTGNVIRKNVPFCKSKFRGGGMTACKHANGRDYWIVIGGLANNSFYKFLLTPDSILGPFIQNIGPPYPGPFDNAYSKFSQDGSKYATGAIEGLVTVMNFDRCAGEFSNPVTIYNEASDDPMHNPVSGCVSVEFSPNGRFLYVSDRVNLNQYDLQASNIQDSVELYRADSVDFSQMDMLQLAPNGKLYASTWNGGAYYFHVINQPDSLGDSCHFVYGGLTTLTANSDIIPNMINYKLGPLVGSACDTLQLATASLSYEENTIRILPNPADKYVYVEMGMQGNYVMQLLNEMGQLIAKKETRQVDIFNTERLTGGVYFLRVIDKKNQIEIAAKKVVVQH